MVFDMTAVDLPEPQTFPIEFFERQWTKTAQLIGNSTEEGRLDGSSRWFTYHLKEPMFVESVTVQTEGYSQYDRFEVEAKCVDGETVNERVKMNGQAVPFNIGRVVSSFSFKPPKKFLASPSLTRVTATGLSVERLREVERAVRELSDRRAKLNEREAALTELEQKKSVLTAENQSLTNEVGKSRAELEGLRDAIENGKREVETIGSDLEDFKSEIRTARETRRALVSETEEERQKLKELRDEVRLFPSEITGFVREGNRSIGWYVALALPFAVVVVVVLTSLFSSAVDLTQLWRRDPALDIWTVFLTRIPFVLVAVFLIEACSIIVGRLIFEIIRINRQRLDFAKLSIVAKDVSVASANGTELSDDEVFEKETKLKMELLREHMRNYTGSEFEHKGSALMSALVGVAKRFSGASGKE